MSTIPSEIASQVASVQAILQRSLEGSLCAVYLFGSALHGGLKPSSDIDLMAVVREPLVDTTRRSLMQELLAYSAWPGTSNTLRALEVTVVVMNELLDWRYPPKREMQFGEWLREDIEACQFGQPMVDADLAILVTKLRRHSVALYGPPAVQLLKEVPRADLYRSLADTLELWKLPSDWHGDERNVMLALARIWYTASTGDIATKDQAAAWAAERMPDGHRELMKEAADSYLRGFESSWADVPEQVANLIDFCKREIERCPKNRI